MSLVEEVAKYLFTYRAAALMDKSWEELKEGDFRSYWIHKAARLLSAIHNHSETIEQRRKDFETAWMTAIKQFEEYEYREGGYPTVFGAFDDYLAAEKGTTKNG